MRLTVGSLDDVLAELRTTLEQSAFLAFLQRQRWFGGKARAVAGITLRDWHCLWKSESPNRQVSESRCRVYFALWDVNYADGVTEQYFVPLALLVNTANNAVDAVHAVAEIESPAGCAVLFDALADDDACHLFLSAIEKQKTWTTRGGRLFALLTSEFAALRGPADRALPVHSSGAEQSNTNVHFGDRLVMKLFRRAERGPSPDFEISRFLTERTRFQRVPRLAGGWLFEPKDGESPTAARSRPTTDTQKRTTDHLPITTLAMLQGWVANEGNAWEQALAHLAGSFDRLSQSPSDVSLPGQTPFDDCEPYAKLLGRRTGELHLALASDQKDPAFRPEPLSAADLQAVSARMRDHLTQVFPALRARLRDFPAGLRQHAEQLLAAEPELFARLETPTIAEPLTKIRCHGDYHLGQVLVVKEPGVRSQRSGVKDQASLRPTPDSRPLPADFVILDFEGEPTRPLAERRGKYSPLKDVAGMVRSYHYAAHAALLAQPPDRRLRLESWAAAWQHRAAAAFVDSYCRTVAGSGLVPKAAAQFHVMFDLYVLEKALYELHYELNNRPDWVAIPVQGLLDIVRKP
jgi:predicted trehalose synthase